MVRARAAGVGRVDASAAGTAHGRATVQGGLTGAVVVLSPNQTVTGVWRASAVPGVWAVPGMSGIWQLVEAPGIWVQHNIPANWNMPEILGVWRTA